MKNRHLLILFVVILSGISASFVLINALVQANSPSSAVQDEAIPADDFKNAASPLELPIRFPYGNWPWYAQGEIFVNPEPPIPGRLVEICAQVVNDDVNMPHAALLEFGVAPLGIGVPYRPIGAQEVVVPPAGSSTGCAVWTDPEPGRWGIEVLLSQEGSQEPMRSLRNLDLWEPLVPGEPHELVFQVGPFESEGIVTFTLTGHQPGWEFVVDPMEIRVSKPGEIFTATLKTTPPRGVLLGSGLPIVDVEGFLNEQSIGGFRKLDSPGVPLHIPADPVYAEREITVTPYPPLAGEPTEICVELRNPTPFPQDVLVTFSWADFGIGLPFTPINGPRPVHLPPYSAVKECIHWVPPVSGHICLEVTLEAEGYAPQRSQRNIDVDEPLKPGVPDILVFPVGNPLPETATITLGLIPHLPDWKLELSQDVLPNMEPGQVKAVELTVTPPAGVILPPDNTLVVDVEAYAEGRLIGGFRKIFRPPVPLHPFPDPPYAEREITITPYPPLAGEPTEICVELRNPTPFPQDVLVTFSWADFGIGLPFAPIDGPRPVHLPPYSAVKECIHWVPPVSGHMCLQVTLESQGYAPQRSQRNIDVNEPLKPGVPDKLVFPVGNPLPETATITLGLIPHLPDWKLELSQDVLPNMEPGQVKAVELTVTPPEGEPLPPDHTLVVDVEAYVDGRLIGGFRKIFRPPVPLHPFPDPPYAEREITVTPYPPLAGEPTEICVELRNPTPFPQDVLVTFSWADFGIGLPFTPIDGPRPVHLPPYSAVKECIHWVPPVSGHMCLQVTLESQGYAPQRSQRNLDVDEPLMPGVPDTLIFPVGNPLPETATITLGLIPHLPDWKLELSQDVLMDMQPGQVKAVELTVTPPAGVILPPDNTLVVDVEAYAEGRLIGGFRKIFRPPVPIHPFPDPPYAEREITVTPYPPRLGEPTEVCVELRNPTPFPQDVLVTFSWADFGIGLPFAPIDGPRPVHLPPYSAVKECIHWVPPVSGHMCLQVTLESQGYAPQRSQRNLDVDEPLMPGVPDTLIFPVGNPLPETATITLGLIPHLPDWKLELSQDVLMDMQPGQVKAVELTVTPPAGVILPPDNTLVVDVEAYAEGRLIGGFRKIFRPPVPIHRPRDPIYAESEIGVDPYPVIPGVPTKLSVEVFNPTDEDQIVEATFSIAPFGIGLPFQTDFIEPNPIQIFVPANGAARGFVVWKPPVWEGKFCVKVTLEMEGHEPIWSQRNIDVGEPLKPGVPHDLIFPVGSGEATEPVTVTLGLIPHKEGWQISLSKDVLPDIQPDEVVEVTLTVIPPLDAKLGTGEPIVDVEAFVEGELLGGFRKLDIPPVPIHKPHEKGYAESEISIDPYPPQEGEATTVSAVVQNTSDVEVTVDLEYGWADFGMGIPFTTTGMLPFTRTVTLSPSMTSTQSVEWTPVQSGHQCVIVHLTDPAGIYEPQQSQRNVDIVSRPPCGEIKVYTFTVYNDQPVAVTVDLGLITFNVPADWVIELVPSGSVEIEANGKLVVEVRVTIPCPNTPSAMLRRAQIRALQEQAGGSPIIDVEGYVEGELIGGIELQFDGEAVSFIYLPVISR